MRVERWPIDNPYLFWSIAQSLSFPLSPCHDFISFLFLLLGPLSIFIFYFHSFEEIKIRQELRPVEILSPLWYNIYHGAYDLLVNRTRHLRKIGDLLWTGMYFSLWFFLLFKYESDQVNKSICWNDKEISFLRVTTPFILLLVATILLSYHSSSSSSSSSSSLLYSSLQAWGRKKDSYVYRSDDNSKRAFENMLQPYCIPKMNLSFFFCFISVVFFFYITKYSLSRARHGSHDRISLHTFIYNCLRILSFFPFFRLDPLFFFIDRSSSKKTCYSRNGHSYYDIFIIQCFLCMRTIRILNVLLLRVLRTIIDIYII